MVHCSTTAGPVAMARQDTAGSCPIGTLAFPLLTQHSATFLTEEKCNNKAKHNTELKDAVKTDSTFYRPLDAALSKDMIWALSWKIVNRNGSPTVNKHHAVMEYESQISSYHLNQREPCHDPDLWTAESAAELQRNKVLSFICETVHGS